MSKRRNRGAAGITVIENAVMDLWDGGASRQQILGTLPAKLGVSQTVIESVLGYMRENRNDRALSRSTIANQSATFLAALRLHHPERCGA